NYSANNATVLLGNSSQPLAEDPVGSGIRTSTGRGNLSGSGDVDYWSFTGKAGDRLVVASEVPGDPGASQLFYDILQPDGNRLTYFYPDYYGRGQSPPVTLPVSGTYTVAVSYYYEYYGEYRLRVTLAPPPIQLESEGNDNLNQANTPGLAVAAGHQTATV